LAEVLKFSFYGPTNYNEQLGKYLHRMKVLLVLDNFEHLRAEGAKVLAFLLAKTHLVKILLTSRERLGLIAERILEVHGLPVPTTPLVENADNYSSIKLFVHNAQKTFPRFNYQNNTESIIKICQLVDGIPLGILLASSWVRVFSCLEIAAEIKKSIEFLTTSAPDIDPRHRSLSAVFENSWKLLLEEEGRVLRRLSIFQAAFTAAAAQEICDATQLLLSVFVDKSLLNHRQDGRFEMLATFHQYASVKLAEVNEELAATKVKFCEYYADFCDQKQPELNGPAQCKALSEMVSEIENIRTAWGWMVDSDRWDLIDKVKNPILFFHIILGNYIQGGEFFQLALQKLNKLAAPELELTRASMQEFSAWMTYRNGFIPEAVKKLSECLEIFRLHNSNWDTAMTLFYLAEAHRTMGMPAKAKNLIEEALMLMGGDDITKSTYVTSIYAQCQSLLGIILIALGDFEQARQNLHASLDTHNRIGTYYGSIHPLMGLGKLAYLQGNFLQARDLYLQALDTSTNIYNARGTVLIHNNLGAIYEDIVDINESHHHIITALKLCKETGDRRLTAVILNNLAYLQLRYLHLVAESIRTYHEAIAMFSEIGDLRGIAYSSYDVSKAYLKVGLVDEARKYCSQSLNTAMTLDSTPLTLHALHGFANLFAHTHAPERALRLCNLIENHPQIELDTRKRVIVTRVELETTLSPEIISTARNWCETQQLQDVINQILTEKIDPRGFI
jgi:predicted ATPase/Flp pilus assembly protein TadD